MKYNFIKLVVGIFLLTGSAFAKRQESALAECDDGVIPSNEMVSGASEYGAALGKKQRKFVKRIIKIPQEATDLILADQEKNETIFEVSPAVLARIHELGEQQRNFTNKLAELESVKQNNQWQPIDFKSDKLGYPAYTASGLACGRGKVVRKNRTARLYSPEKTKLDSFDGKYSDEPLQVACILNNQITKVITLKRYGKDRKWTVINTQDFTYSGNTVTVTKPTGEVHVCLVNSVEKRTSLSPGQKPESR